MNKKTIIFGAGESGLKVYYNLKKTAKELKVIKFADNNHELQGKYLKGLEIISPSSISKMEFGCIYVGTQYTHEVVHQLQALGVDRRKIVFPDEEILKGKVSFPREEIISALGHLFVAGMGILLLTFIVTAVV